MRERSWVALDDHQQIVVRTSRRCSLAHRSDSSRLLMVERCLHETLLDDVRQTTRYYFVWLDPLAVTTPLHIQVHLFRDFLLQVILIFVSLRYWFPRLDSYLNELARLLEEQQIDSRPFVARGEVEDQWGDS